MYSLTQKQTAILYRTPSSLMIKENGEAVKAIRIAGAAEHKSMRSLESKGLVKVSPVQPFNDYFVFMTRKGLEQIATKPGGILRSNIEQVSLTFEERTEKEITLNKNDRYHLRKALAQYKPDTRLGTAKAEKRIAKLLELLKD